MYESFYNLRERPFTLRPDPAFLYLSPKHALALSMLEYGLTGQTGFVVVTGEVGSGKTTIIRQFLRLIDRTTIVGVISNTHVAFGDILQWVFQALDIDVVASSMAARYQAFTNYLIKQYGDGYQVVLIVDEAQNLTIDALEELRLLSNINADRDEILQIILVGQPELLTKLQRPELRQFAQRISLHHHLLPLTYTETCNYIRHRLSVAGADHEVFDALAMGAIYNFTDGVPRLINSICDMALVYGFSEGKRVIDINVILSVVRDREGGGIQVQARKVADLNREALIDQVNRSFCGDVSLAISAEAMSEASTPIASSMPAMNHNGQVTGPDRTYGLAIENEPAVAALSGKTEGISWPQEVDPSLLLETCRRILRQSDA